MPRRSSGLVALAAALAAACGGEAAAPDGRAKTPAGGAAPSDLGRAAAVVDGEAIGIEEVRALAEAPDAGLTAREALEALVDERLLAAEAARRGAGGADVEVERQRALARRLLARIRDGVTAADIDPKRLEAAYEAQKGRFVHGALRGVVHAVALAERGSAGDAAARALAGEIRASAEGAASAEEFEERARPFQSRGGVEVRIERLPDFAADTRAFEKAFVDAAFAVPRVGGISPPFRTSYGWHVACVAREIPPQNVPFAEARAALADELLPAERRRRVDSLLERLARERGVFVYEAPAAPSGSRPTP